MKVFSWNAHFRLTNHHHSSLFYIVSPIHILLLSAWLGWTWKSWFLSMLCPLVANYNIQGSDEWHLLWRRRGRGGQGEGAGGRERRQVKFWMSKFTYSKNIENGYYKHIFHVYFKIYLDLFSEIRAMHITKPLLHSFDFLSDQRAIDVSV